MELAATEARSIALGAQLLMVPGPASATDVAIRNVATRLGALQIDTVNALVRAHYLPLWSRLGPYPVEALDRLVNEEHVLVEDRHGHQASYVPVELEPHLRWRRQAAREAWRARWREGVDPAFATAVERKVAERGPIGLSDLEDARRSERRRQAHRRLTEAEAEAPVRSEGGRAGRGPAPSWPRP